MLAGSYRGICTHLTRSVILIRIVFGEKRQHQSNAPNTIDMIAQVITFQRRMLIRMHARIFCVLCKQMHVLVVLNTEAKYRTHRRSHIHSHASVHRYVRPCVYKHAHTHTRTHTHTHTQTYAHTTFPHTHTHHTHIHTHTHTHTHLVSWQLKGSHKIRIPRRNLRHHITKMSLKSFIT